MSEAAAKPAPEPLTLREIVAAHTDALAGARLEMAALRRALDATKLSPGRMVTDGMLYHAASRIADYEGETLRLAGLIGQSARLSTLCEMFEAEQTAELAVVPEPVRRGHRKPRQARQPGTRSLRSLGAAVPAGAGLRAAFSGVKLRPPPPLHAVLGHKLLMAKVLLAAGASTALVAVVVNMPASRTLEDRFSLGNHPSASVPYIGPWGAERITLPSSAPTAYVRPSLSPKPVVTLAAVPVEVPVVAAPEVTSTQTGQPSQTYQPDTSSGSSQTYQPSGQSQPSRPDQSSSDLGSQLPDLQAHGKHAAPDSGEGNPGYQGQHQRGGGWQGGIGQLGNWQNGNQQNGNQLGGNWQGGQQQDGHGQFGGASNRPSLLPGFLPYARP